MSSGSMVQQILPAKLRVIVERRTGDERDPPHVDFAGVGAKELDLLNIDLKFPSEHTVCGKRYDGEMQYYFYHPVKKTMIVVAWLIEVVRENDANGQMQLMIDQFQKVYDENVELCINRSYADAVSGAAVNATKVDNTNGILNIPDIAEKEVPPDRRLAKDDNGGNKKTKGAWDPFHPDIQKTVHFWGYDCSLTETPCFADALWRIMDVPVRVSTGQLHQMQIILFNNLDPDTCKFSSVHQGGSVARPSIAKEGEGTKYYKCTRSDYVSDDERDECGDHGCVGSPYGAGTEPYFGPIVDATGPPSRSPTLFPTISGGTTSDATQSDEVSFCSMWLCANFVI